MIYHPDQSISVLGMRATINNCSQTTCCTVGLSQASRVCVWPPYLFGVSLAPSMAECLPLPVRPRVLLPPQTLESRDLGQGEGRRASVLPFVHCRVMVFLLSVTSEVRRISCGVAGQKPHGLSRTTWSPSSVSALRPPGRRMN